MLPERCIIEDVHKSTVNSDSDATQRKRRSYGDQVVVSVRRNVARSLAEHFSPTPARETVRDMIIIQDQGGGGGGGGDWFGDVIRRLDVNVMKVLCVLECNVAFDDLNLLAAAPLRVLVLSDCSLRALPSRVFEIVTLEVLKIDRNCVEEIPEELGNLCRLRTFCCDAQRPRLKSLPQTISRLERLEVLSLCDNRIASIAWAATLPNLRVLRCASNRIDGLPSQLVNLSQLTWLDVSHNPIDHVPRTLEPLVSRLYRFEYANRRLRPRSARRFRSALTSHLKLENLLAATTTTTVAVDALLRSYVSDVTIMVLGETGSGKTTLLQALKDDRGICRQQQETRNRFHPLEIHRFDMTHSGAALANGSCDSVRPSTGTPSSGESSRVNFSIDDGVHASCYVTGIAFSGEYLDNYTRDVHADLYLVLLDLTTLEQHQMGSPPHLLVRHLARLQMWLQAAYEMSPTTPVLIVGTHAELVKAVTFHDVCGLLDELLAGGRQNHVRRFSDDVSRNCVLCNQRALAAGHALSKSRSGQSWFMDQSSPTTGLNPTRTNGKRASSASPPETIGTPSSSSSSSAATGKTRFPHVVGYQEVDCKKCFPRDTKKVNASVDQLKASILRLAESRHRIPADWLAFNRQLVGLGEQTHGVPCLSYEDAVSVARNFEISVSLVPTILHYFHRRGSLVFFPGDPVLSRIVIVSPVWLLETLERVLLAQADARTDSLRLHRNLSDRELDRLFLKARVHELNGTQWLAAVAERLECCASLWPSIAADPRKTSSLSSSFFFPRLLRFGSPAVDVWPETPEPDDRQVAYDVTVRNVRPRMFQEFLLSLNDVGRRILEILPAPVPVYLSHEAVFFSALDNGACDDCRGGGGGGEESIGRRPLSPRRIDGDLGDARINDILHKVHFALRADHNTIRVTVRGPRPCCVVKSILRFLEQHLNDDPEEVCSDPDGSGSGSSFRSCSCAASEDESAVCYFRDGDDDDRSGGALCRLLCPKCVLLRDASPDRISAQTMNSRNRAVCNKWHNLGSWSRAVTGEYQLMSSHPRPFCLSSGAGLPDYEHPRLAMLLPPSTALSQREWQATGRVEFLEGYEVQFLCENFTYWHLTDGSGVRLRSHLSSDESSSHVLSALVALAIPMVHLVLGIGEHPTTPRLLAPVVSDLLQMYDYLRIVDVSTQDAYSWLLRYKDRLVAMLARVLANVSSVDGGPQQHPDVFIKAGTALGPSDLLQSATVFSREDLGRLLQLETSSSRFGCLRPIYSGKEIRWVCETHYEELRTTHPSVHFNS